MWTPIAYITLTVQKQLNPTVRKNSVTVCTENGRHFHGHKHAVEHATVALLGR